MSVPIQLGGALDDRAQEGPLALARSALDTGFLFLFGAVHPAGVRRPRLAEAHHGDSRNRGENERLRAQCGSDPGSPGAGQRSLSRSWMEEAHSGER